ncbi:hypothetical protein [Chimaeribacter arupi]|uniref:hypothetical protein n=1 Tax=Chimaeribacter arupi TaxID=2060066 RepID=UPI0029489E44|nr:hypothetical protein [Chimaeribacter arupi]MDV5138667.1 hypothetical protein [Chimaeribacter arupi]
MTIVAAIKKALVTLNRPATYEEVYQEIMDKGLYDFGAKDPKSVIRVKLRIHTLGLNFPSSSPKKYFKVTSGERKDTLYTNLDVEVIEKEDADEKEINVNISRRVSYYKDKFLNFLSDRIKKIDKDAHKATLHECFWMLVGSFLPIIVDSCFRYKLMRITFWDAIYANVKSGEIFLLTSALITPFFFFLIMTNKNRKSEKDALPYFGCIFIITLVSFLSGLLAFVFYRTGIILIEKNIPVLNDIFSGGLGAWAWLIYGFSLIVWYYSAFMNHKTAANYKSIRDSQFNGLKEQFNGVKG